MMTTAGNELSVQVGEVPTIEGKQAASFPSRVLELLGIGGTLVPGIRRRDNVESTAMKAHGNAPENVLVEVQLRPLRRLGQGSTSVAPGGAPASRARMTSISLW